MLLTTRHIDRLYRNVTHVCVLLQLEPTATQRLDW